MGEMEGGGEVREGEVGGVVGERVGGWVGEGRGRMWEGGGVSWGMWWRVGAMWWVLVVVMEWRERG
ncbi:hypothetical protein, partial [Micrococcus luteus]|uniref:hypothetical protein n=1 Tax=Micrococcus luteus TaxID=1270 RepID=UPI001C92D76A